MPQPQQQLRVTRDVPRGTVLAVRGDELVPVDPNHQPAREDLVILLRDLQAGETFHLPDADLALAARARSG